MLAGCGQPHAELELKHRIQVLEQQVQKLQEQQTAKPDVDLDEQVQEEMEPEPLLVQQKLPEDPGQKEQSAQEEQKKKGPETDPGQEQSGDGARQEYSRALQTLRQGDPEKAKGMFQDFLEGHEGHELAPNAYYWLGECLYVQKEYAEAILSFKEVSNQFSDSDKVPDALLKMGYCYLSLGQDSNASFYLQTLKERFPESKAAELAQKKLAELDS
ncbi:MAG: tol-pal system protein YbgF [Desulfohalobiaceae bacterium]